MSIRLVLADVDGTLVTKEKILTERAIRAVEKLRERNIVFAITSGRPPRGMAMLIEPLKLTTPIAAFNGGMWINPDFTEIESHTLPRDAAAETVEAIEKAGLDVWLYRGTDWLVRDREAPHVAREAWTVKFEPTVVKDFDGQLDGIAKIVGISDDLDRVAQTEKQVQSALGDRASAARSQPYYLDVTHASANKGSAVEWLARRENVPLAEVATLGDQPNDTLMFAKSGLAIAMGQASDEVKARAHKVTASSEEEGFARAIEAFVLGERENA